MNNRDKALFVWGGFFVILGIIFFGMAALCVPALLQHARTPIPALGTILCGILTIKYTHGVCQKNEMNRKKMFQIMVIAGIIQFLIYLPIPSWSYPYSFAEDTLCKFAVAFMNQPTIYFIGKKMAEG